MRRSVNIFLSLALCLAFPFAVNAVKTVTKVEQQKKVAQKEIKETTKKINQNNKQTKRQLNQLNLINAEIAEQGRIINDLGVQVNLINNKVKSLNDSIGQYDKKLALMRGNYIRAIKKMRCKGTQVNQLLFIFSSDSFTQAIRRMRYLHEFSRWRKKQSDAILEVQSKLRSKRQAIAMLVNKKQTTLSSLSLNKTKLEGKKKDQATIVEQLQAEGSSLQAYLKEKEAQYNTLDRELNRLIVEEERKAAERARIAEEKRQAEQRRIEAQQKMEQERRLAEERRKAEEQRIADAKAAQEAKQKSQTQATRPQAQPKPKPVPAPKKQQQPKQQQVPVAPKKQEEQREQVPMPSQNKDVAVNVPPKPVVEQKKQKGPYIMDKGEEALSGSFESNQGRLLSPVTASYKIVKPFGRQRHPELRHVETNNGGIDIETVAGANARAVFDGKVSVVFKTDGFNTVVMLRHGNYLTVYVNLEQSYVSAGQTVKAGQPLGKIFSDPDDDNRTILHFEIRKEREKLNPQSWIK